MSCLVAKQQEATGRNVVKGLCRTLSIGRSSYYRGRRGRTDPDLALRDRIHMLSLSWPSYGYRPMTRAPRRLGYPVNHKRVLRHMREDNLLALRRKAFVSTHRLEPPPAPSTPIWSRDSTNLGSISPGYPTSPT